MSLFRPARVWGRRTIIPLCWVAVLTCAVAGERLGSRFAYLDERDPYYPNLQFPKLTTPMWVGEPGVEAVVLLSIDDMSRTNSPVKLPSYAKAPEVYHEFLRPVIERLRRIDGRAPITVFTLQTNPDDPVVQRMLAEGLSIEAHTYTHPVPFFRTNTPAAPAPDSLAACRSDFLECVANLHALRGNRPVAFRMPGCDGRNTTSPRFYAELFPLRTPRGEFLAMDSSIFTYFTADDPALPRDLLFEADGREKFGKFVRGIPYTRHYHNSVVNYPYPYVINGTIWELPAMIPGDAHGVHAYKAKNPQTVADWQRAIDLTVLKQGLYTLCFHPHGYIENGQVAELVDTAARKYGKRIKFLNCPEIHERLTTNLLGGATLRSRTGADNGVRLLDVNGDGYLDVVIGNSQRRETRIWDPRTGAWKTTSFPVALVANENAVDATSAGAHFFTAEANGRARLAIASLEQRGVWQFDGVQWVASEATLPVKVDGKPLFTAVNGMDRGVRFRDLDGDGLSDLIVNNEAQNAVFWQRSAGGAWERATFALPRKGCLVDANSADQGLRFVDLNGDGKDDLVLSNDRDCWVRLFEGPAKGWSKTLLQTKAGRPDALPAIVSEGRLNGVWFHSGAMLLANEFTAKQPDLVERHPFSDLLVKKSP